MAASLSDGWMDLFGHQQPGYASSRHLLAFPFNVMRDPAAVFVAVIAETKLKS